MMGWLLAVIGVLLLGAAVLYLTGCDQEQTPQWTPQQLAYWEWKYGYPTTPFDWENTP